MIKHVWDMQGLLLQYVPAWYLAVNIMVCLHELSRCFWCSSNALTLDLGWLVLALCGTCYNQRSLLHCIQPCAGAADVAASNTRMLTASSTEAGEAHVQKSFDYAAAFAATYASPRDAQRAATRHSTHAAAHNSISSGQRRLQQLVGRPFDYASAFAASYAKSVDPAGTKQRRSARLQAAGSGRRLLQQEQDSTATTTQAVEQSPTKSFDYAAAFAASYTPTELTTDNSGQRRLQTLQQVPRASKFDYAAAFAASYASAGPVKARRGAYARRVDSSSSGQRRLLQQKSKAFDYAAAFAASYTSADPNQNAASRTSRRSARARVAGSSSGQRRLQQQQAVV